MELMVSKFQCQHTSLHIADVPFQVTCHSCTTHAFCKAVLDLDLLCEQACIVQLRHVLTCAVFNLARAQMAVK